MESDELSFGNVDDILNISPTSIDDSLRKQIVVMSASHLGPAVEYLFQQSHTFNFLPPLAAFRNSAISSAISNWAKLAYSGRLPRSTQPGANEIECVAYQEPNGTPDDAYWTAFCQRADKAAQAAGFHQNIARGLVGALGEMADNLLHSTRIQTGLVGYHFAPREFEFVVADNGIGVLQSLRTCVEYSSTPDHYSALKLALSGKSCFGSNTGHGWGFQTLFRNLADLNGSLRFRSGDWAAEISGETPQLQKAVWKQRPHYQGFMVSVLCRC